MTAKRRDPGLVATYRLQLRREFDFDDAAGLVPYLRELGVSHLYLSPILQAVRGSPHGYDQCDPGRVSDELGGPEGFARLVAATHTAGMGIVLDIVPNHVAASDQNPWWWALLESGPGGPFGDFFDIDWNPPDAQLAGRVLLPVLADRPEEVLAAGALRRTTVDGQAALAYGDQRFPLRAPGTGEVDRALLDRQVYELAPWWDAATRLNYRRFFDISGLVAVREEDPLVFEAMHRAVLALVRVGDLDGLRVDHVDGLRDPAGYLARLRAEAPGAWLLVEKILDRDEELPEAWPIDGTTGYEFMNAVMGVFIDPAAEASMTDFYTEFTGEPADFQTVARDCRLEVARELFEPDLRRLERLFAGAAMDAGLETTTASERQAVLAGVAAAMPVYRAYSRPGEAATPVDRSRVELAVGRAGKLDPTLPEDLLRLLRAILAPADARHAGTELALRFQQLTGALMAKGVEDTAFYRYNRLDCLNEVGGDPGRFGTTVAEFHAAARQTAERRPRTMLAGSTHDAKRSEDVRARLSLLTRVPDAWAAAVRRWSAINDRHRVAGMPDRSAEYLLYQALVGAWPVSPERMVTYMEKAAREARRYTSWTRRDEAYEQALRDFTLAALGDADFTRDLAAFVEPLREPGFIVSLAACLVRMTAPGIPDIYQGSEAWDLSLVDPDNRRPVDFGLRRDLLALEAAAAVGTIDPGDHRWEDGLAKLHVVHRALALRRARPEAFAPGSVYTPVAAGGPAAGNLLAFGRGTPAQPLSVVVAVPRLTLAAEVDWAGTALDLPAGTWRDLLWGGPEVPGPRPAMDRVFARHTLALLERVA